MFNPYRGWSRECHFSDGFTVGYSLCSLRGFFAFGYEVAATSWSYSTPIGVAYNALNIQLIHLLCKLILSLMTLGFRGEAK